MTAILVLVTFAILLTIDYLLHHRHAVKPASVVAAEKEPRLQPEFIGGFAVPENLRYHLGHTWALSESPTLVRIGLDDFAARLLGKVERIELPQRGQWVRQGQKIWTVLRNGGKAEMVSPMEGIITDINDRVLSEPELARREPYGEGWLVKVNSPDAKLSFRNLLGGSVARKWMEEAGARLRARMLATAPALAQDGGMAVDDISRHLPEQNWVELTQEFFLT